MRPGLKGFSSPAAAMNPPRKAASPAAVSSYVRTYSAGSYDWRCPKTGTYRFVLWGSGGGGDNAGPNEGGGGGAHVQKTARVRAGQLVPVVVGGPSLPDDSGAATTVALPSGLVSAGGGEKGNAGAGGAGGIATGGDVNVNGSDSFGSTGGASASSGLFAGGGVSMGGVASIPGGGGGISGPQFGGGGGYLVIVREGP